KSQALKNLIAVCRKDRQLNCILEHYRITKEEFTNFYKIIDRNLGGAWMENNRLSKYPIFLSVETCVHPETLEYMITTQDNWAIRNAKLIDFFTQERRLNISDKMKRNEANLGGCP